MNFQGDPYDRNAIDLRMYIDPTEQYNKGINVPYSKRQVNTRITSVRAFPCMYVSYIDVCMTMFCTYVYLCLFVICGLFSLRITFQHQLGTSKRIKDMSENSLQGEGVNDTPTSNHIRKFQSQSDKAVSMINKLFM